LRLGLDLRARIGIIDRDKVRDRDKDKDRVRVTYQYRSMIFRGKSRPPSSKRYQFIGLFLVS
jgi:hypothetical protein